MNSKIYSITSEGSGMINDKDSYIIYLYHGDTKLETFAGSDLKIILSKVFVEMLINQSLLNLPTNDINVDVKSDLGTTRQNESGHFITMDHSTATTLEYANEYNSMLLKNALVDAEMKRRITPL